MLGRASKMHSDEKIDRDSDNRPVCAGRSRNIADAESGESEGYIIADAHRLSAFSFNIHR